MLGRAASCCDTNFQARFVSQNTVDRHDIGAPEEVARPVTIGQGFEGTYRLMRGCIDERPH